MLQNDNILSKEKINILEQNYIESNSAPFVTKILLMYQNYMSTPSYRETQLRQDFQDLYHEAEKVNPAALPYADLTTLVFEDEQDSSEGFIIELKDFYTSLFYEKKKQDSLTTNDERAISVLAKAAEHLNLALSQKNSLYKKQKDQLIILENGLSSEQNTLDALKHENNKHKEQLQLIIDDLTAKLHNAQEAATKNKEKYDKMTIDFLSMMGIFSTIIFAVFGGLSQIGAIGDNLAETPISKILMYVSLSSITLILIVFISFNAISKLTGLKLKSCTCKKEEECQCTLKQKHPTLSFSLFFFVDLFLFSLVLKAIRYSDWVNPFKDMFILKADNIMKFLIFGIFIIFNFLVLLKLLWPKTKCLGWIKFI